MFRRCPKCKVVVERVAGCNKMTCSRCGAFFCWLCNKQIQGYDHFKTPCGMNSRLQKNLAEMAMLLTDEKTVLNPDHKSDLELQEAGGFIPNDDSHKPKYKLTHWKNSKKCPFCKCTVEKKSTDNNLLCFVCGNHFCFVCNKGLKKGDMGGHFGGTCAKPVVGRCVQHTPLGDRSV
eukprot:GDKI01029454.1.p1 GENE.GDKI01029454.1~~GDKI01029454.1.p1  ORF type:complete len:176 (-),score=24.55 GDKI01029454.1:63-590(-)